MVTFRKPVQIHFKIFLILNLIFDNIYIFWAYFFHIEIRNNQRWKYLIKFMKMLQVILFTIWRTGWQLALHFPWVSTILNNFLKKNQNIPLNIFFSLCEIIQSLVLSLLCKIIRRCHAPGDASI